MNDAQERDTVEAVKAAAERILAEKWGEPFRLDSAEPLGGSNRSRVMRCSMIETPRDWEASGVTSVIVKRVQGDRDRPYDPEDAQPGSPAWRFFNDWAGLEFLTRVGGDTPSAPRFYGGDRAMGLVVLEDLGAGESLADHLTGSDPALATEALLAWAATTGRMHAATIGRAEEYQRLRDALAPSDPNEVARSADGLDEAVQKLREGCDAIGVPPPTGWEDEAAAVAASMQAPGPFFAYTHGDPCPDNDRYTDGHLRLFDFEFGGYRHALLDGVYGRILFPTCWCVNRLPAQIPPQMEAVYRADLAKGCPEAGDDSLFHRAVAEACARWMLTTVSWHLSEALEKDGQWGLASLRQRLLVRLEAFAATTEEFNHLETLGRLSRSLASRLRGIWPTEADQMPLYPAFREHP